MTDQRPDIVVWSSKLHEVWVIELTVCFETGFEAAQAMKTNRYADLMEQITSSSMDGTLVTLEVGSRGFLALQGFRDVKNMLLEQCGKKKWEAFLTELVRTAVKGSHKIWTTWNYKSSTPTPT